ncbi:HD-GYP domain-containing protein [Paenibacillus prosopidis]|uniref:Putative nucleotidyltransferase with HDIG domain n=1 Tax=Paenibacillus prosopidis TaxID=630520 RepID=A0A368VPB6_9BACL|nr:HD domain-containing phosphohydrolase [Paenibacillus prosopidis]RCW41660.1 putative nucleotidyltransferase with HDIG domain [Paenibacillus prosopidis]
MRNPVNRAIEPILSDFSRYLSAEKKNIFNVFASQCLFESLRLRDPKTSSHSLKMGIYAYLLATKMDASRAMEYFFGGLVHDVGKIAFPDFILNGKKLVGKNREQLKKHVVDSVNTLVSLKMPEIVINIAKYHHERLNGSGYPRGVQGDVIPLEGKIAAVADVYSAITEQDRGYQPGRSHEEAFRILRGSQEQFDPLVLHLFFKMFKDVNSIDYVNEISSLMPEKIFTFEKYLGAISTESLVNT